MNHSLLEADKLDHLREILILAYSCFRVISNQIVSRVGIATEMTILRLCTCLLSPLCDQVFVTVIFERRHDTVITELQASRDELRVTTKSDTGIVTNNTVQGGGYERNISKRSEIRNPK